jgi:hypothetical protein
VVIPHLDKPKMENYSKLYSNEGKFHQLAIRESSTNSGYVPGTHRKKHGESMELRRQNEWRSGLNNSMNFFNGEKLFGLHYRNIFYATRIRIQNLIESKAF